MTAPAHFVLVHPPLLGPAVWRACADVLRSHGHLVDVPDLRATVADPAGWWDRFADACTSSLTGDGAVVVAHSGSGVVLPLVAVRGRAATAVFVDAIVPAQHGVTEPSDRIRSFTRQLSRDGRLPVWTDWWPADEVERLLPDPQQRAELIAELPALPSTFYDHAVPVPDGWNVGLAVRYLQLSAAYDDDAAEARTRGWPVERIDGTHLEMLTDPAGIAAALERCLVRPR